MGTSSPFRRVALPFIAGILIGVLWVLVSGCSNHSEPSQAAAAPKAPDLRILAGSELKELEPDIKEAARKIGLDVEVSYSGTLDMVDRINAGESSASITTCSPCVKRCSDICPRRWRTMLHCHPLFAPRAS